MLKFIYNLLTKLFNLYETEINLTIYDANNIVKSYTIYIKTKLVNNYHRNDYLYVENYIIQIVDIYKSYDISSGRLIHLIINANLIQ